VVSTPHDDTFDFTGVFAVYTVGVNGGLAPPPSWVPVRIPATRAWSALTGCDLWTRTRAAGRSSSCRNPGVVSESGSIAGW